MGVNWKVTVFICPASTEKVPVGESAVSVKMPAPMGEVMSPTKAVVSICRVLLMITLCENVSCRATAPKSMVVGRSHSPDTPLPLKVRSAKSLVGSVLVARSFTSDR